MLFKIKDLYLSLFGIIAEGNHLFEVKYASIILDNNFKTTDIVRASGLNPYYGNRSK